MFHDYAPVFIIGMLNSFAEKTENGIIDFDTYVTDPEKYDGFLIYDIPVHGAAFPCRSKVHPSVRERLKIHDCQVGKTKSSVCVSRI